MSLRLARRTFVALVGVALAILTALPESTAAASGTTRRWILTGSNLNRLRRLDRLVGDHFFSNRLAFADGNPAAQEVQVPNGYRSTPTLKYDSYADFAADVTAGRIDARITAVLYDPEHWPATPAGEQRDPYTYLRLFSELAHAHSYEVIATPARDLMGVPGGVCVQQEGETYDHAFVRCDIAGAAAQHADVYEVQAQRDQTNVTAYTRLVQATARQARAANPRVVFLSGLSTSLAPVTSAQLFGAARSVAGVVDGHYVSICTRCRGELNAALGFFRFMQRAGY